MANKILGHLHKDDPETDRGKMTSLQQTRSTNGPHKAWPPKVDYDLYVV